MSAQALAVNNAPPSNLRTFDLSRDLLAVADLVELCFKETLDADGRLYIRQMRRTAGSGRLLSLAEAAAGSSNTPPGGFVWIEADTLVGNLSLIPVHTQGIIRYLIANVAVHPDFRRKGIARSLTKAAIARAEQSGAKEIWLQVDEGNLAAQTLYQKMGFANRAHRVSWQARPQPSNNPPGNEIVEVSPPQRAEWEKHQAWLNEIYPLNIRWNLPIDIKQFQPGWRGTFQRFLGERRSTQWAARKDGELLAILTWQSSTLQSDRLWLATSEENELEALPSLLSHLHRNLRPSRNLILNYPAGRAETLLAEAGFSQLRGLIWMQHAKS